MLDRVSWGETDALGRSAVALDSPSMCLQNEPTLAFHPISAIEVIESRSFALLTRVPFTPNTPIPTKVLALAPSHARAPCEFLPKAEPHLFPSWRL